MKKDKNLKLTLYETKCQKKPLSFVNVNSKGFFNSTIEIPIQSNSPLHPTLQLCLFLQA